MTSDSIVNVTEAQAKLSRLIDQDSFAISRHGKIVGIYLSGTGSRKVSKNSGLFYKMALLPLTSRANS